MNNRIFVVCALPLFWASVGAGQAGLSDSALSCIVSLELPTHGLLATRAAASATITAVVSVGADGKAAAVELAGGDDALKGEVNISLSLSRFAPECRDRKVEIVYAFTLQDPPTDSIVPPAVRFVPPNRFELTFRRVKGNIDPAPPKPTSTNPEK